MRYKRIEVRGSVVGLSVDRSIAAPHPCGQVGIVGSSMHAQRFRQDCDEDGTLPVHRGYRAGGEKDTGNGLKSAA
jgi:hypothetical protein